MANKLPRGQTDDASVSSTQRNAPPPHDTRRYLANPVRPVALKLAVERFRCKRGFRRQTRMTYHELSHTLALDRGSVGRFQGEEALHDVDAEYRVLEMDTKHNSSEEWKREVGKRPGH